MANSRQSATIFSPSSKRPTKRTRSSITEHSFQGIASSLRGGSVTYVSGTNCHPCVGSLRAKLQLLDTGEPTWYYIYIKVMEVNMESAITVKGQATIPK